MYPNGYSEAGGMPPPSAQQRPTTYQPPMHSGSSGPLLHSPTNAQFYGQALPAQPPAPQAMSVDSTMSTPQSTTQTTIEPSIDTKRVQLLLELNNALIQEVMQLQANGRAGSISKQGSEAQAASPTTSETAEGDGEKKGDESTKKGPPPSREYMECMFRLRHNFAYLTNLASRSPQKQQTIIERPQILEPISANIEGNTISEESMNAIRDMYRRLKELFPTSTTGPMQHPPRDTQAQAQAQLPPHLAGVSQLQQPHQRRMDSQMHSAQAQVQAQQMQQQIMQHQQQMAAQAGNMTGMSSSGMGRGQQHMNPQMMQQNMMARNMAMQNHQAGMGQGM